MEIQTNDVKQVVVIDYDSPMTMGQWIGTLVILMIPLVNIIFMLIWAFKKNVNRNKKNYSRAMIVVTGVGIVLYFVILFPIITNYISNLSNLQY